MNDLLIGVIIFFLPCVVAALTIILLEKVK